MLPTSSQIDLVMAKVHNTWSGHLTQRRVAIDLDRVWIDGCFDAMHFGSRPLLQSVCPPAAA
jgi:hypothetical protein